jgi:DNA-binding transcriptional ArsR family regulator
LQAAETVFIFRWRISPLKSSASVTRDSSSATTSSDQSTVSKHLAILKDAGLIASRKEGTTSFYRVTCGCLDGFFACLETMVESDFKRRRASTGRSRR